MKIKNRVSPTGGIKNKLLIPLVAAILIMLTAGVIFYFISRAYVLQQAEKNITNLLLSHKGIHHYVQQNLLPAYLKYQADGEIPSTFYAPELLSSSYIVRNQHLFYNQERKNSGLPELYYKLAADNPRNPINQADAFEKKIIDLFNDNRELKSYRQIIEVSGKKHLYIALPFLENNAPCLRCHGNRTDSPLQLQQRYPGEGGFNEKIGRIRAITSIRAPLEAEYTDICIILASMLAGLFALATLYLFNSQLRNLVRKKTLSLEEEIKIRTQTEERLQLTRISVEAASDALYWIRPDTRIVDVNEAACRSLAYSREELLRLTVPDIDLHYSLKVWPQHFAELRQHGTLRFESEQRTKDGRVLPVEIVANYVQVGTEEYNCAFVRDISERKQAEEERTEIEKRLRQSQKMEAIGTLAGGIAHDFNNILSAIFGYTELAIEEEDTERRKQNLSQVIVGAKRAKELVKQILSFSRKTEETRQAVQPSLIFKEAIKMLRSSIPTTIEIRQELASNGTILADPIQLQQIIMNLCTNAYQAMHETGGILAISLAEIEIGDTDEGYGELAPGRYLKLTVSDTGCGMSPEIQEKIFEPYFTTKKTGEGTGLGLAMVHGIVKSHLGHLTVYSEQGKGTTFNLYLPILPENVAQPAKQEAIADLTGKGERILFVDDEAQIRDFSNKLLSMHGYQVVTSIDGLQALEKFKDRPDQFDLVITDMTMPYLTGTELAQKILAIRPEMPIIICSGQNDFDNKEKALAIGIHDSLAKPIIINDLLAAIRRTLAKNNLQATKAKEGEA